MVLETAVKNGSGNLVLGPFVGRKTLILTHMQPGYEPPESVVKTVNGYIIQNCPDVFQLLAYNGGNPLIPVGKLYQHPPDSWLPSELKKELLGEKRKIVVAGGLDGLCLGVTIEELEHLRLKVTKLRGGTYR